MSERVRRALVGSDSYVARDPRVLKQIDWLVREGYTVDSLGRGRKPDALNGEHFEMVHRSRIVRVVANVMLPNAMRNFTIVESTIPQVLRSEEPLGRYGLVVVNEIELLPWFTKHADAIMVDTGGHKHLDLHEFSPSQASGLTFRLLFKRYRRWLTSFIPSQLFDTRSVVADGIAELYADLFAIPQPAVVRNCPPFEALSPSPVKESDIRLVHHGGGAAARRIDLLIDAMAQLEKRFSLHLMLVGSPGHVSDLRRRAQPYGDRIVFHQGVPIDMVASTLNAFDIEVIFYPPVTENLRLALPNKFFEAVQGRLGTVIGASPEMRRLVDEFGNGTVIDGWEVSDLARGINALTAEAVTAMKESSHAAARTLNAENERSAFLRAVGIGQPPVGLE